MNTRALRKQLLYVLILLFSGQVWAEMPKEDPPMQLLWVQTSAEYRALCYQAYNAASHQLDDWAPLLSIRADGKAYLPGASKPVAIVLDLDETVIDNSGFEAFVYRTHSKFNQKLWKSWVEFQGINKGASRAVPGAAEFLRKAEAMGITPVYLSNREVGLEKHTIKVLKNIGVNQEGIESRVLLKQTGEAETREAMQILKDLRIDPNSLAGKRLKDGEGHKEGRRAIVRSQYDVLAYFGDAYSDFEPFLKMAQETKRNFEQRQDSSDSLKDKFGTVWFVLPNPVYGYWAPGKALPEQGFRDLVTDYGFETYLRARRMPR